MLLLFNIILIVESANNLNNNIIATHNDISKSITKILNKTVKKEQVINNILEEEEIEVKNIKEGEYEIDYLENYTHFIIKYGLKVEGVDKENKIINNTFHICNNDYLFSQFLKDNTALLNSLQHNIKYFNYENYYITIADNNLITLQLLNNNLYAHWQINKIIIYKPLDNLSDYDDKIPTVDVVEDLHYYNDNNLNNYIKRSELGNISLIVYENENDKVVRKSDLEDFTKKLFNKICSREDIDSNYMSYICSINITIKIRCIDMLNKNKDLIISINVKTLLNKKFVNIESSTILNELKNAYNELDNLNYLLYECSKVGYVTLNLKNENENKLHYAYKENSLEDITYKNIVYHFGNNNNNFGCCISCNTDENEIIIDEFINSFCWNGKIFKFEESLNNDCNSGDVCLNKEVKSDPNNKYLIRLTSQPTFGGFIALFSIFSNFDFGIFEFEPIEDNFAMQYLFNSCSKEIEYLDLGGFITKNAISMSYMFYNCYNLHSINLSSFDTSKVEDMDNMFQGCQSLTSLNITSFNTSLVKNMNSMFNGCSKLTSLNLSSFDTSNVTSMFNIFGNCEKLETLDISNFNTSLITSKNSLFFNCNSNVFQKLYIKPNYFKILTDSDTTETGELPGLSGIMWNRNESEENLYTH